MSDVERGSYAPLPEEHDFEPEEYDADEQEEAYSRGPFLFVVAVFVLAAFGGVVYAAYKQGLHQGQRMAPPVIVAEAGPEKIDPANPGGFEEPFQDTLVLNGESDAAPGQEKLLPPPEEPAEFPAAPEENAAALDEAPSLPEMNDVAEAAPAPVESAPVSPDPVIVPRPDPAPPEATPPATMEDMIASTDIPSVPEPTDEPEILIPVDPVVTGSLPTLSASSGAYVVQVASVPQNALAEAKRDDVAQKHSTVLADLQLEVHKVDLGSKGTYYRVRVGPFKTRPQAVDLCETLKARGQDCYVTKP